MQNKLIASGLGLVGFGYLWGWAITGDRLEAKMKANQKLLGDIIEKKTKEAIAAKELLLKLQTVPTPEEEQPDEEEPIAYDQMGDSQETDVETRLDEQLKGETIEETRAKLVEKIAPYTSHPEDREAFAHMASRTVHDEVDNTPPFVISEEDFGHDEEGQDYAKLPAYFYPSDNVLLDDEKEIVENRDIDGVVGWKNLQSFGDRSGNPDVVYIRNRRLLTDFEVIRETDEPLPAHVRFNVGREEFEARQATSGVTRFRRDDV